MKKRIIKKGRNKLDFGNYLNPKDHIRFFLTITYKKTNIFLTYFFKNSRFKKSFLIRKVSCGYTERQTAKVKIFQRNRYKRVFGYVRPRIMDLFRYIALLQYYVPHLKNYPLHIKWNIYKIDNTLLLILTKCSLFKELKHYIPKKKDYFCTQRIRYIFQKVVRKIKIGTINFGKKVKYLCIFRNRLRKIAYYPRKYKRVLFRNIYTQFFFKKSHNGCKLSKHRYIKKRKAKKALQIHLQNTSSFARTFDKLKLK